MTLAPAATNKTAASSETDQDAVLAKVEMERKLSMAKAWEEHEKSKVDNRDEQKMSPSFHARTPRRRRSKRSCGHEREKK